MCAYVSTDTYRYRKNTKKFNILNIKKEWIGGQKF